MRGKHTLMAVVAALGVFAGAWAKTDAAGAGAASTVPAARLTSIASRVDGRTTVVTIEASEPVPYVASQPDARTYLIELRDIDSAGFTDAFKADAHSPIASVQVEGGTATDGASVARIRMTLTDPVRPRVRSARNVLYVETDRIEGDPTSRSAISTSGPASVIRDVRATERGSSTALTLYATGRIAPTSIELPKDGSPHLELDLPNVTSAMPSVVPVSHGPVDRVRIGLSPRSPLVTRVVLDLNRRADYRVEQGADGNSLTLLFDTPADALAAARAPRPPAQAQTPAPPTQAVPATQTAPAASGAPAARTQSTQVPMMTTTNQRSYTGHPVSLDFQGADLRAVLRTFAEISGLNIVIDPTIQGSVDVALRDVPWDQALDIILRANKLRYTVEGTIVRIVPTSVLQAEEEEQRKLADAQVNSVELTTRTFALSYAKAADISTLLKSSQVLSSRGNPTIDERTNTLIVTDAPSRMQGIVGLISTLDQPQPQVEIEARIVQTNRNFARTLGVQWGIGARASAAIGNTLPLAFPNQGSVTGRTGGNPPSTAVNLGAGLAATSAIGIALGSINGALNLDIALSALEQQGQGRILSTPRVATQNNVEAEITQGVQIPIQTVANNTVTVTFKDAALTLKVTPQITAANTVIMRISVENASPDFTRSVNNIPPINTQRALTSVLVSNGETTVIGGIYVSQEQAIQDRTPGLHRLPLLGWLFKRDQITDQNTELLIFITPRIVRL